MLARVASNLFWMGRYIERAEHLARFMNVNYFSSLDAPNEKSQNRQLVLRSMLFMADSIVPDDALCLEERDVIFNVGLDASKPYSIINAVKNARENANSARDLISTELYESLNKFYHFVLNYDQDFYTSKGLHDFTQQVSEATAILRGKIRGTLLHDEIYAIIMLGVNIERASQVSRIVHTKYHDAVKCLGGYKDKFSKSYEWTTLLKCVESYDMMRRYYKQTPTSHTTLEFLLLHPACPRSVMNSLNQVQRHIETLNPEKFPAHDSAAFAVGKAQARYKFMTVNEIEGTIEKCLEEIQTTLFDIAVKIEKQYFNY